MVSVMNDYVSKINLTSDPLTQGILQTSLDECLEDSYLSKEGIIIEKSTITIRNNRFIVDIHLKNFSVESAVDIINYFMEKTRYHYSAFFIRFNEGSRVRYRYASCKENKEGFYCDIIIS